ncbi:MAG: T9SS type A sorting domain-containing protein, partial [Bacteroidota bacterium]
ATTVTADAGEDQAICLGESVTLTASGGSAYSWSTGSTKQSIKVRPDSTTTYTVTVLEGNSSDTDDVKVTVNALPVANAGTDQTIESGQSTTLTATGGSTYQWSNGETTQSITVNPKKRTTYSVTVTNTNGCEDTDKVVVSVSKKIVTNPPPANAYAGEDIIICEGECVDLIANDGSSYKWSTGETQKTIKVCPIRTTTYKLFVTNQGIESQDEVIVVVKKCDNNNSVNVVNNQNNNLDRISSIKEDNILAYPNPTNGLVNIQIKEIFNELDLYLIDLNGRIVYTEKVRPLNNEILKQIDLSRFAKGFYIVKLVNNNQNFTKKIVYN